jgi:hypothetical protein
MSWIYRINNLSETEKEGLYRILIPPPLYRRLKINPLTFRDEEGKKAVRFFCPPGDRTCLTEIKPLGMEEPIYSLQISDTMDFTQLSWDFVIVNDPSAPRFLTDLDQDGKDTLFGWASRNLREEERAMEAGLSPGQVRRGLKLTSEVLAGMEFFCRILDIKSIRLEALFYHNAIAYERLGFSYFTGYHLMKAIQEQFQPGGKLFERLDHSSPFRRQEFAGRVLGRSWAIHDGILLEVDDERLQEGWASPVMYKMVGRPRGMITFPDPIY